MPYPGTDTDTGKKGCFSDITDANATDDEKKFKHHVNEFVEFLNKNISPLKGNITGQAFANFFVSVFHGVVKAAEKQKFTAIDVSAEKSVKINQ